METAGKLAPLGFGFMRLPLKDADDPTSIDIDKCCELVDIFMDAGFTYFDSARGYHGGKSEWALRKALVERYPRDSFTIATKLPAWLAENAEHARAMFDKSLRECGIDYFDYYLLHNLGESLTPGFEEYGLWDFCAEKKAEGKIKKFGFSIHDNAEELEKVLDAHPEVDFVQLQINYIDWESPIIQSRRCYEVCQERGLPVVIMEPVKGGTLANVPEEVTKLFKDYNSEASVPSWAIRFAASLPNVKIVLSGMSDMDQLLDNTSYMQDLKPLNDEEKALIKKATDIINASIDIPCTGCSYCTDGCPMQIAIPKYFSLYNADMQELRGRGITPDEGWTPQGEYYENVAKHFGKASACIQCGQCEGVCPQHLPIIEYLQTVAKHFERE